MIGVLHPLLALRSYQLEGAKFLASRRFALLADEMRVGKTPQAIIAAVAINARRILVVCPAIAVPQWRSEFERWWPSDRRSPTFDVMSYDKARTTDFSLQMDYDVAIIDECHFAKNPDAQRTKKIYGKDGIGWHARRMWSLSGTPATKHAGELYPMFKAYGITALTYDQFTRRYCDIDFTGVIRGTKQRMIPELKGLLAQIMLRRTRKQVAPEMDEIVFEFLAIDPMSQVDLPKDAEVALQDNLISVGLATSRREVALAKALPLVEEIAECLERGDYQKTVVFGWHRDAIHAVRAGLEARGVKAAELMGGMHESQRTAVQQEFRIGKIQVVVAQIIAAGTAIDLSAASHGYFLELDWVPGSNVQAANRLVSMMKDEPVTFDICTMPGSVDDRVQRILLRRTKELRTILA